MCVCVCVCELERERQEQREAGSKRKSKRLRDECTMANFFLCQPSLQVALTFTF